MIADLGAANIATSPVILAVYRPTTRIKLPDSRLTDTSDPALFDVAPHFALRVARNKLHFSEQNQRFA